MISSENKKVRQFLEDLKVIDHEKYKILIEIREIILNTFPETGEKIMYGGIIFFLNDEMFSGLFAHKNHISLEFSKGFLMKDPNGQLEGSGKYRRHLKITSRKAIVNKDVAYFVKQSL